MYQPYPGGDQTPQTQERPPVPSPVRTAIRLMYVGAAASLIGMILVLSVGLSQAKIHQADPSLTPAQVNSVHGFLVASAVIGGIIGAGLWLVNVWGCSRGGNWSRILGTVFFGINTLSVFLGVARPQPAVDKIYPFLTWLIGLGAVYFLWQRESTAFFTRRASA